MLIPVSAALQNIVSAGNPSYFTGGVVTVEDHGGTDYRVHTFNESGTLTFVDVDGALDVDYLVVAGGGGGGGVTTGNGGAGGGGAGGLLSGSASVSASQTVTIGAGGPGIAADTQLVGGNGSDTSIGAISTSTGGGGGGGDYTDGVAGGSGGGAGGGTPGRVGGSGVSGQGFAGGAVSGSLPRGGGGGGGASEVGATAVERQGAAGGDGLAWLDGTTYAGGGGGGSESGVAGGAGGAGGGGAGANSTGGSATPGTANTGGGGGGAGQKPNAGSAAGGSGVVKIRYVDHPSYSFDPETDITWHSLFWAEGTAMTAEGYSDTDSVTIWPNETAEVDVTQSTGTAQPTFVASSSALNSKPAVSFDGGDTLTVASFTGGAVSGDYTMVVVGTETSGNGATAGIASGTGIKLLSTPRAASRFIFNGAWNTGGTTVAADSDGHIFHGLFSTTGNEKYLFDGVEKFSGVAGNDGLTGVTLGGRADGVNNLWTGEIAFAAVYEGDLTADPNYTKFLAWVNQNYGVQVTP